MEFQIPKKTKKILVILMKNPFSPAKKFQTERMNKKQEIIERIEKLSEEQFELLIALYSQQEQEFVPNARFEPLTFPQPA